ncbi:hypothetical protein NMG60_11003130 [Bertholletia excelsa]
MANPTTSQAIGQVVATVATPIKDTIFGDFKHHSSYLFSYEGKIKKLQEEVEELCHKRNRIQEKVDNAQNSAQVIYDEVLSWLVKGKKIGSASKVAQPARFPTEMLETSSEDYMNFQSRDLTFLKILEALKDSNVKMILVHRPGGVDKIRMVKEVTKQVKGELSEQVIRVAISQETNVKDIQDKLAAQLNLKFDRDGVIYRKSQLYNRLKYTKKKVLVIMDDIWKKEDMDGIGVPFIDCKILLDQKDISIRVLKQVEAWELFKKTVVDISNDDSMAREVCEECGGLLLAILVVGATLKGKDTHAWKNALHKIKNSTMPKVLGIDPKIYTSLKLSYDNLEDEQKYGMAMQLLSGVETFDEARDIVNLLLNGKDKYFAKMHDIVRDVVIYITKRKESPPESGISKWSEMQQFLVKHNIQKWPEKDTWKFSSAISLRLRNIIVEPPNDFCCLGLHTLILEPGMLKLPQGLFGGMEKVTVLVLIKMSMLSLPPSLASLVNLRMLFLNSCKIGEMNVLKDLKDSIEILSLNGSKIEVLPSEIGQLTRLHLLDLENFWPLQVIPKGVFSNLLNLEELYVPNKFKNWEYSNLEDEIKSMGDVSHLPNGHFLSTRIVNISSVHIKDELKILLEGTEELHLTLSQGLKCLDHLLGEPKYSSKSFSKLTALYIEDYGFKYLPSPSCARSLQQLQRLEIKGCQNLEFVVVTNLDGMEANNNNIENLKGFCSNSRSSKSQPLFSCQVLTS